MPLQVNITSITGTSPFDIYFCDIGLTSCFYIDTITGTTYQFLVPEPYDTIGNFSLKVIDANNCVISGST